MMDAISQKRLAEIGVKSPVELTADEVGFIRARSSYLNYDQKVKFAKLLGLPNEQAETEVPEAAGEAPEAATVEKPKRKPATK